MTEKLQRVSEGPHRVATAHKCPHISSSTFKVNKKLLVTASDSEKDTPRRNLFAENYACQQCGDADETWVCLQCSFSGCSTRKSGHIVCHATDEFHDHTNAVIAISLADFSVWCFSCDACVAHPKVEPVLREFQQGKLGIASSRQFHVEGFSSKRKSVSFDIGNSDGKDCERKPGSQQKEV